MAVNMWWKYVSQTSPNVENILYISSTEKADYTLYEQVETDNSPPWRQYRQTTIVEFQGDTTLYPLTLKNFFQGMQHLKYIRGAEDIVRSSLSINSEGLFSSCSSLINVPYPFNQISSLCKSTSYMFSGCDSLASLDLSNFNTSNVTDMSYMFNNCIRLASLDVSNFDTSNVTNMKNMFNGCSVLASLDVSGFNTSNVTDMSHMFNNCIRLASLDVSNFDTSNVTDMSSMFFSCGKYATSITLDVSNFDTSNVTNMSHMFGDCYSLESLDLSNFDTSNVTSMYYMFRGCSRLTSLDVSGFDISNVTNIGYMFESCRNLVTLFAHPNADWNISTITNSTDMFTSCTSLVGGNGTAHGTSTTAAHNDKTRARMDKAGQEGYFTIARRTLSKNIIGNGTVTGDGEYDYGTTIDIVVSPDTNYYIDSISKTIGNVESTVTDEDTISSYRFSIELTKNTVINAVFNYRNEYELTINKVGGDYTIKGAGMYRYLDKPIVVADMNEGLIVFLGWYDPNDLTEPLSRRNPYTFSMPNHNYTIEAHFGDAPFEDLNYRQFILTNGNNELFRLAAKNEKPYLDITDGLGFNKKLTTYKIGLSEKVQYEEVNTPSPKGQLYFYEDTNSNIYKKYNDFIRFIMIKPLTLWYKVPIIPNTDMDNTTFHIPVEVTDVGKIDIDQQTNALICPITFYGLGFWKETQVTVDTTGARLDNVYNDGDFECGVNLTLSKEDNSEFTNPEILFKNEDTVYGKCKIGGTYTRIIMNSVNGEESIELYNGDTKIEDAFNYIDFSAAEDNIQFPFPKLQNGILTTIEFNYDNSTPSDSRTYIAIYDKGYISV